MTDYIDNINDNIYTRTAVHIVGSGIPSHQVFPVANADQPAAMKRALREYDYLQMKKTLMLPAFDN